MDRLHLSEDMLIQEEPKTAAAHIHGGGLASSIVAKQCGHVTLVERDVQVLNGYTVAIEFAEAMEGNAHWQMREILAGMS